MVGLTLEGTGMCDAMERDRLVNVGSVRKSSKENWEADLLQIQCNDQSHTDCIIYTQVNIKTDLRTERKM